MERYAYLVLSLSFAAPLAIMLLIRKDLAKLALLAGSFGGVAAAMAEVFYFRDYWRPPSMFGIATISPEDVIFGFSISVLAVITYLVLRRKQLITTATSHGHGKIYLSLFVCGLLSMLVFNVWLGINSIFVSSIAFLLCSLIMLSIRRDLIAIAIYSMVAITLLTLVVYIVLFDFFFKEFWHRYWLLHDTPYGGLLVFGHVPLTELLWYFSWAAAGSVSYPFITGKKVTEL